jgi:hypothetical protein
MSAKKKSLETGINKMNKDRFESTERISHTAYKVAKKKRKKEKKCSTSATS